MTIKKEYNRIIAQGATLEQQEVCTWWKNQANAWLHKDTADCGQPSYGKTFVYSSSGYEAILENEYTPGQQQALLLCNSVNPFWGYELVFDQLATA